MSVVPALAIAVINKVLRGEPKKSEHGESEVGYKNMTDAIIWLEDRKRKREDLDDYRMEKYGRWAEKQKHYEKKIPPVNLFVCLLRLSLCPCCKGFSVNFAKLTERTFRYRNSVRTYVSARRRKYHCKRCGLVEKIIHYCAIPHKFGDNLFFESEPSLVISTDTYKEIVIDNTKRIISYRRFGMWYKLWIYEERKLKEDGGYPAEPFFRTLIKGLIEGFKS